MNPTFSNRITFLQRIFPIFFRYIICLIFLLAFQQTGLAQSAIKSKQLAEDYDHATKDKKLEVRLDIREQNTGKNIIHPVITVSLITNGSQRIINGKPNPTFKPSLRTVGTLNGSIYKRNQTDTTSFFLYYNKEYLVEVSGRGYISQKFTILTYLNQDDFKKVNESSLGNFKLKYYARMVWMVPCPNGNCIDNSNLQYTVSFSSDSGRFNMITNKPIGSNDSQVIVDNIN